jgi:hypothetical protein
MLAHKIGKKILSESLVTFYNQNQSTVTIVLKSVMSDFLVHLIVNGDFVKILILLVILV